MTKQKAKQKRWWVSRDGGGRDFYNLHHSVEKPVSTGICYAGATNTMYGEVFHKLFALRLRKGECKEIERAVLVLKKGDTESGRK